MKRTVEMEPYFTEPELACRCFQFAQTLVDLEKVETFVEPSAGEGSFYRLLPEARRFGIDIEPRAAGIVRADFLDWTPPSRRGPTMTIGNPPFGQRAALAIAFLRRACEYSDVVAFVLPRSFNKYTFQNRVDPYFHLLGSFDCEEFYGPTGATHSINTVFQVWERRSERRLRVVLPETHPDFDLRHCHLSRAKPGELHYLRSTFEFAIAQVGSNFSPRDPSKITKGSHWFVRPKVAGVRERFERLDFAFLDGMNIAHKSLSKRDIISAYVAAGGDVPESEVPGPAPEGELVLDLWPTGHHINA